MLQKQKILKVSSLFLSLFLLFIIGIKENPFLKENSKKRIFSLYVENEAGDNSEIEVKKNIFPENTPDFSQKEKTLLFPVTVSFFIRNKIFCLFSRKHYLFCQSFLL
jgi:hypothetical protein